MPETTRYTLHGSWGARSDDAGSVTDRLRATFAALVPLGEPLAGPWMSDFEHVVDVTDADALRAHVESSPERDSSGQPVGGGRFAPAFRAGNFDLPQSAAKDIASLEVRTSPHASVRGTPVGSVALTVEGSFAVAARDNASALVEGFVRAWQPEYAAFTDDALLAKRSERRPGPGRPSWGYVGWVSDAVSRGLESVDGAATSRLGAGTLIVPSSWNIDDAAAVWALLLDSKRLRAAPAVQEAPPAFA